MSALPRFSDVDLFGNGKRVVHLDPYIADVLSIFVWPSRNWTARRFPVFL